MPGRAVSINMSDDGPTRMIHQFNITHSFRQVGWLGHTGNVYAFAEGEDVVRETERGGYAPLYLEIGD